MRHTMFGEMTTKMAAKVSVTYSEIYLGAKVRDALDVGYNDKVRLIFTDQRGDEGWFVSGYLNSANRITVSAEKSRELAGVDEFSGTDRTIHVEAFVEAVDAQWSDDKEPTEKRFHGSNHLPAENAN